MKDIYKKFASESGVTLAEVLIGIAVLAVVITIIFGGLLLAWRVFDKVIVLSQINRDLIQIETIYRREVSRINLPIIYPEPYIEERNNLFRIYYIDGHYDKYFIIDWDNNRLTLDNGEHSYIYRNITDFELYTEKIEGSLYLNLKIGWEIKEPVILKELIKEYP